MEHNTSSYEKVPLTSAMGEEKKTIQSLPTKEQKRAESVAPLQPNPTSTAKSVSAHDILAATSRHTELEDSEPHSLKCRTRSEEGTTSEGTTRAS